MATMTATDENFQRLCTSRQADMPPSSVNYPRSLNELAGCIEVEPDHFPRTINSLLYHWHRITCINQEELTFSISLIRRSILCYPHFQNYTGILGSVYTLLMVRHECCEAIRENNVG